ncbi:transglutaminase-like domain-containing protein [Desulfatibacillum aliphaticivorans]|uniref:transglutaminase-like domain-containing protein n=1 Tax=Desulfatibacillum aliphaticivorans TaxID=218208 RepID=UPI00042048CE|nr:transglutaminase family protein [Desulfatibacillum aliphaticivorans]
MRKYLRATDIIDWDHPAVLEQARVLKGDFADPVEIAKACFEWVRDNIKHSGDCKAEVTTVKASEVLEHGTGWCFAKSHLLAALLRANDIPAGLCYQRLRRDDGKGFTLHGLNAVFLPEIGWYRIDSRGQRPGCDAQFCPPREKLAFPIAEEGEMDFMEIWPDPSPVVVECLESYKGWEAVALNLPDIAFIVE